MPIFAKIMDIIVVGTCTPLLYLELFNTNGINSHILSYEIQPTYNNSLIILSKLRNKEVYYAHTYIGNSELYIVMRAYFPKYDEWHIIFMLM